MKRGEIAVTYTIVEGPQQKFGTVALNGVDGSRMQDVRTLMNSQPGQPFSLVTLSGDRDTVLQYYLSHGFDQVKVEISRRRRSKDADKTDVSLNVTEGQQVFVDKVLLSGVEKTKPKAVESQILVHPGDPLDQTALLQTQRNLVQHCAVQRSGGGGAESGGRRSAEECAAAVDGGEAVECDVWVWI